MESSLALTRTQLRADVGFFLGWSRGADYGEVAYDTSQDNTLKDLIPSGLRRFYYPVQPGGGFYDWSFLHLLGTVILPNNTDHLTLPDDFGGVDGPITTTTVGQTTANVWWPVFTTSEGQVRQLYAANPSQTGRPTHVAVRPLRGTTQQAGQRFQFYAFPLPDQAYQLQFSYTVLADDLIFTRPIPLGGAQHAETILESCLAVAEERMNNASTIHAQKFAELLQASMAQDRRMKPQNLGYNRDRSDFRDDWNYRDRNFAPFQYNGVVPG